MKPIEINIFFVLKVITKYKKFLLVINVLAIAIAAVVSFVLPVYYESKVVFYPYSPESSDPRIMLNAEANFSVFSDVDQSERYILIGKSVRIKELLIQKYDLYTRYNIKNEDNTSRFKIMEEIASNLKIRKQENGSVAVSVLDMSRDTAAFMANDVVAEIEKVVDGSTREKNQKIFAVLESQFLNMKSYVQSLRDSLIQNRKSLTASEESTINKQVEFAMEEFTKMKVRYEQARTISTNDLKSILIVEPAQPPLRKAKPFRAIIVGTTLILSVLLTVIGFSLYEYIISEGKELS